MIEKEEWMHRHKKDEKAWNEFKQYCLDCGFKSGTRNGQEVIFSPSCGLGKDGLSKRDTGGNLMDVSMMFKPNLRGCLVHKNKNNTIPALFHMWYFAQNGCPLALVELENGSITSVAYQNVIFVRDEDFDNTFELLNHIISEINSHESEEE